MLFYLISSSQYDGQLPELVPVVPVGLLAAASQGKLSEALAHTGEAPLEEARARRCEPLGFVTPLIYLSLRLIYLSLRLIYLSLRLTYLSLRLICLSLRLIYLS
jgi:hypothetical protein